jgi:ubiquinone biosynthesis protein UbiJ
MIHEALLAPVQFVLDRGVAESTSAAALCARLEGKSLLMRPAATGLSTHFVVEDGRLLLRSGAPDHADAEIAGSLLSLMRLATDDPQQVIRQGAVQITGDSDVAEDFQALLGFVRPDLEEELARVTGDPVAHEVGRATRGLLSWATMARHSLARSLTEFLVEETHDLASVTEIEEFCGEVDEVSLGIERAESKLQLLREQIASPANSDAASE